MRYLVEGITDVGNVKKVNQDALFYKMFSCKGKRVLIAAVCDGLGGLDRGELASATVVRDLIGWTEGTLKFYMSSLKEEQIKNSLRGLVRTMNDHILAYGRKRGMHLGTTMTVLILWDDSYMIAHVGDTRVYLMRDGICQLTEDQTFIQREIRSNRMTKEEAMNDPRRNMLLQSVGTETSISPEFYMGEVKAEDVFLICSDGFRHKITKEEIYESLNASRFTSEEIAKASLQHLVMLDKERMETDNISAVAVKVMEDSYETRGKTD